MRTTSLVVLCGLSATAAASDPVLIYAENATGSTARQRAWNGSSLDAAAAAGSLSDDLCQVATAAHAASDQVAVVTIDESRAARLLARTEDVWDSGASLTSDAGTFYAPVAGCAYEETSGDLLIVYRSGSNTSLRYRTRIAGVLSAESTLSLGLSTAPESVLAVAGRGSDEVLVLARAGATLAAAIWSGSAFGTPSIMTTAANLGPRTFSGAFESDSGEALVAWGEGTSLRSRTLTGGSWSSAATAATGAGQVSVVRLAANPLTSSDRALACFSDSGARLTGVPWTGSAWGSSQTLDSQAHGGGEARFSTAWAADGSAALTVWARNNAALVRARRWDGTSWAAEFSGPTLSANLRSMRLVPSGESGLLGAFRLDATPAAVDDYLLYAESSTTIGSTTVYGRSGANISGIDLPASPGSSHGSSNQFYGNNQTITIAPGSYGDYTFGQGPTINLSAGTYRFKTFDLSSSNHAAVNADTSAGDVVFILANGNLQPGNTFQITTSGGGRMFLHIVNGSFQPGNTATLYGVDVRIYNGSLQPGNNFTLTGTAWASGSVQLSSGAVYPMGTSAGTPGPLVAAPFTATSSGSASSATTTSRGSPMWDCFGLAQPPAGAGSPPSILTWQEVDPHHR
jgi:hypothetical protein